MMKKDWTNTLKDKMADYSETPSEGLWTDIESAVAGSGKRKRAVPVFLKWASIPAAAALLLGVATIYYKDDNPAGGLTAENGIDVVKGQESNLEYGMTGQSDENDLTLPSSGAMTAEVADTEGAGQFADTDAAVGKMLVKSGAMTENETKNGEEMVSEGLKDEGLRIQALGEAEGIGENGSAAGEIIGENANGSAAGETIGNSAEEVSIDKNSHKAVAAGKAVAMAGNDVKTDVRSATIDGNAELDGSAEAWSAERENQAQTGENEAALWAKIIAEEKAETKAAGRRSFSASLSAGGAPSNSYDGLQPTMAVLGANPLETGTATTDWASDEIKQMSSLVVYNQPAEETEYTHKIPVKIGMSVRYNFAKRFGLESGLNWSYLASTTRTEKTGGSYTRGEQTLHYIGIPLKLSFDIFQSRYVDLYVSAGGEAEKRVKGRIKTDEYVNGTYTKTFSTGIKPKGMQYSVNAQAGVQVNILPKLGIYVEPGVSHYFKSNDNVKNIYSDKPTSFSLAFGLRYDFGK